MAKAEFPTGTDIRKEKDQRSSKPMLQSQSRRPVDFVGEPGPGAMIDQYLPQPGQHTGRRILKIEDIPAEYFLGAASEAGTLWTAHLGVELADNNWNISEPERLSRVWFDRFSRVTRVHSAALAPVRAKLNASARAALGTSGSLVSWARGGAMTAARQSSAPDEAGNSDPLPLDIEVEETEDEEQSTVEQGANSFADALTSLEDGMVGLPTQGWGGTVFYTPVDLAAPPEPALFLVQVVGISSFLGDYGLGRTVKTLTLLPGEIMTIHTRTWRATEVTIAQSSSIIDSIDDAATERFAETVLSETTDTATRDKSENWHVEVEAGASIGIASANISGGGGGEYASSTEAFAKSLDEAVREHAVESSSHRENTVSSSSESSESTENEEVIERTIKNINVGRVLNYTFRELNQRYQTKTHLKDIRIGFTNGNAESWREEPVSGLYSLIKEFVKPEYVEQVCSDILATIAVVRNVEDVPVRVLEQVRLNACGTDFHVGEAEPDDNCHYPPPTPDGRLYYRFKRGPLAQPPAEGNPVDGVLLSDRELVMATDSVVVEALPGQVDALDKYSYDLQIEAIREKRLSNDREELAQQIVRGEKRGVAGLYQRVFGVCCEPDQTEETDT